MNPSDSITTREAARRLGVSLRTVQLWVESNVLPAWKTPGGHRRIPVSAISALHERQEADFLRPLRAKRGSLDVLLVEDDEFQRELIAGQLQEMIDELTLRTAADGFEALVRAGQRIPDVLVTDILMPGMDGLVLLRRLHDVAEFAATRMVVISALGLEEIGERGGLPGGVVYLPKPVDPAQLRIAVEGPATKQSKNKPKSSPPAT